MSLLPLFAGLVFIAAGTAGLVVSSRANGTALAGFGGTATVDDSGFRAQGDDDFSYAGRVDHRVGAKRRLLSTFLLIVLVGVVGALLAGGVVMVFRVLWSTISKVLPAS